MTERAVQARQKRPRVSRPISATRAPQPAPWRQPDRLSNRRRWHGCRVAVRLRVLRSAWEPWVGFRWPLAAGCPAA
jgi:hypothetical protein